jgi:hypothetical protein
MVTPLPPPAGFSSSYQKMLVDRHRLARQVGEPETRAQALQKNVPKAVKSDGTEGVTPQ